jgi:hypothetical protein
MDMRVLGFHDAGKLSSRFLHRARTAHPEKRDGLHILPFAKKLLQLFLLFNLRRYSPVSF